MTAIRKARRAAWRTSSVLGDVQAVTRGPAPAAKRVVRKTVYRHVGRSTRRLLRTLGLG